MLGNKKKWEKVQEAVRQNDAAQVSVITSELTVKGKEEYVAACTLAVENNAAEALKALLKAGKNFYFTEGNAADDREAARKLIKAAFLSSNPLPLLSVLYDASKVTEYGSLGTTDFLTKDTPIELVQAILEKTPSLFDDCVKKTGLTSPEAEKLKFILTFVSRAPEPQDALDSALVEAARQGDIEKAKLLLERQANPDYTGGQALLRAGENNHPDMIDLLLPLMRPDLCRDIETQLTQKNAGDDVIAAFKNAPQKTAAPAQATVTAPETENGYIRLDDETLANLQLLPDGSTLATLFNFTVEQEQLILITPADKASTIKTVSFDKMSKTAVTALRKKFNELSEEKSTQDSAPASTPASHSYELLVKMV